MQQAVKLKPDDGEYQTELGVILIKLAQYQEAAAALKKAVAIDSGNLQAESLLEKAEAGRRRGFRQQTQAAATGAARIAEKTARKSETGGEFKNSRSAARSCSSTAAAIKKTCLVNLAASASLMFTLLNLLLKNTP